MANPAPSLASQILSKIGAPASQSNLSSMQQWMAAEGGPSTNPLNTKAGNGLDATAGTIDQSNMAGIKQAFDSSDSPSQIKQAIINSPWDQNHYAGTDYGGGVAPEGPTSPASSSSPSQPISNSGPSYAGGYSGGATPATLTADITKTPQSTGGTGPLNHILNAIKSILPTVSPTPQENKFQSDIGNAIKGIPTNIANDFTKNPLQHSLTPGNGPDLENVGSAAKKIGHALYNNGTPIAPTVAAKKKSGSTQAAATYNNQLQDMLNSGVKPYMDQLQSIVNTVNQATANMDNQAGIPASVKPSIENFQKLTGKSLAGLIPDQKAANASYVSSSAESQLLNILPTALIYHTLTGNLPEFQGKQNSGLQGLWQVLQNINLGLPNPTTPNTNEINSYLDQLTPTGNTAGSSSTTSSG